MIRVLRVIYHKLRYELESRLKIVKNTSIFQTPQNSSSQKKDFKAQLISILIAYTQVVSSVKPKTFPGGRESYQCVSRAKLKQ